MEIWVIARAKDAAVFFVIPIGVVQAVGGIEMSRAENGYFHVSVLV